VRLTHYVLGGLLPLELLLFSDDFLFLADSKPQVEAIGLALFMMAVVGIPFRWKKFKGGTEVGWIGYWMDVRAFRVGISETWAAWLTTWLRTQVERGQVDMRDMKAVLGRLCFAMAPLEHLRPFLAPIYAWVAAVGSGIGYSRAASSKGPLRVPLPWSLRFLFTYLAEKLSGDGRTTIVRPLSRTLGTAFRADAKAEGQTVVVGGWECLGGTPPSRARWFSLRLDRLGRRPGRALQDSGGAGALCHIAVVHGLCPKLAGRCCRDDRLDGPDRQPR
jgi:hypothetical protein